MKNERPARRIFTCLLLLLMAGMPVRGTEKQIQDLEEDIAKLNAEIEALGGEGESVAQMEETIKTAALEVASTREGLLEKEKTIAANEFLLGVYKTAFRVVTTITPGTDLGIVQLTTGELLQGASFVGTDRGGILVQLPTGSRTVDISLLPDLFADRIQLPPRTTPATETLAQVKQSKPEFLVTKKELIAAKAAEATTPGGSSDKDANASVVEKEKMGDEAKAALVFEEIRQRNVARQKEVTEIKARYTELLQSKKVAREEKARDERVFREAKIKKSRSEVDSATKMHEDKIKKIEAEEARLRAELIRIQGEFE
jgi:hypothetical protein